jgi:hypothetical protein
MLIENDVFSGNTLSQKFSWEQSLFQSCRTYIRFSKWGSLNSIAVRIRVNILILLFHEQIFFAKFCENFSEFILLTHWEISYPPYNASSSVTVRINNQYPGYALISYIIFLNNVNNNYEGGMYMCSPNIWVVIDYSTMCMLILGGIRGSSILMSRIPYSLNKMVQSL